MATPTPTPSAAVLAARGRRSGNQSDVRTEWYIKEVLNKVAMSMEKRIKIATELVRSSVVKNISRPVTKGVGPRGGRSITNRSKPGEYPKADTTLLMKTIFTDFKYVGGSWEGYVGTPLVYGLILETRMNRSFLARTFREKKSQVTAILTGPIV